MNKFIFYEYLADACWCSVLIYLVSQFSVIRLMWRDGQSFERTRMGLALGAILLFEGYYFYIIFVGHEIGNASVYLRFTVQTGCALIALFGFALALLRPIRQWLIIASFSALNGFASMIIISPRNHAKLECLTFALMMVVLFMCRLYQRAFRTA